MSLVVQSGDVCQVDAGDGERPPTVECRQRGRDQGAHGREQDGGVEWLGRDVVRATHAGRTELQGEFARGGRSGQHVHPGTLGDRDLGGEMGRPPESVDTEAAAGRQV